MSETISKVRVYGKAQNRTALGIIHAYMVLNPKATIEDLRNAFPNSLNPEKGVPENFVYVEEKGTTANFEGYFRAEEEIIKTGDGHKVSFVTMWTKAGFDRIVEKAKAYGIEIAKFEEAGKIGEKGGFRLEYLNGFKPAGVPVVVPAKKGGASKWLWGVLIALLLLSILFLLFRKPRTVEVEKIVTVVDTVERVVTVVDTVYVQAVENIEKNFNAAKFKVGKADLSDEAKFVLHDLAKLMEKNPDLKLRLEGHTSAEGSEAFNKQLSEARAKAAVDFLISRGIAADRLQYEGKGSSEPLDPDNLEANRRTEFIVID